jgi:serine/threonine protein kinase
MKHWPGAEGNKQKLHRVNLHWHLHRSLAKKDSFSANSLTLTSFHFFGLCHLQNRLCLVSPWMENGNFQAFLVESKEMYSIDCLISWASASFCSDWLNHANNDPSHQILDVALRLQYLHDKDVVHGDLKVVCGWCFLRSFIRSPQTVA